MGKKFIIKAQVCDIIVSTPLDHKQAKRSAAELKRKIPSAKVKVHPYATKYYPGGKRS